MKKILLLLLPILLIVGCEEEVAKDTTAPTVLITFPANQSILTATTTVKADVTDDMRRQAKTVNFGIIYGISAFGLAERLNVNRFDAGEIIAQYFAQYPGVETYMAETIEFARSKGYVETVTGRRRPLRDINSRNATSRKAAERNAINSRIQGSAADMIKLAMSAIHSELLSMRSKMLLQVHDELVFDLHKDEVDDVTVLVEREMCEALPMKVPITVEMGMGRNWLEAH